jgi:hypothetical protein
MVAAARELARNVLPHALTVLGELGACVLHQDGRFLPFAPREGSILCSDADGTQLFFLRPRPAEGVPRLSDQAIRAAALHERFVHRLGNGFCNAVVPSLHTPKYFGELVIIRYEVFKDLPDVDDDEAGEPQEWEHYFENPGVAPDYPAVFAVGNHQFWVPPGPFKVTADGICHARRQR